MRSGRFRCDACAGHFDKRRCWGRVVAKRASTIVVQLNPSGEGFNLGLADFSAQARLDQELTGMSGLLLCAIERLAGGGGTNLESAIDVAVQELTSLRIAKIFPIPIQLLSSLMVIRMPKAVGE